MWRLNCRRLWRLAVLTVILLFGFGASALASGVPAGDLSTFLSMYRCAVAELLSRVHAHPHPEQMHRFLVLENAATHEYVQCLFFDRDRQMLCEAWSGWWDQKATGPDFKPEIASDNLAALAKLGFSVDASHGNFQRFVRFSNGPDFDEIADLMLSALYSGYNTRIAVGVIGYGPYAMRKGPLPRDRCVPVS